ncbi:MAG: hypothetical protein ACYDCC_03225 [Actinomycetota bacterium]
MRSMRTSHPGSNEVKCKRASVARHYTFMKARCDWCGMEVEVLANGKCLLGHPIDTSRASLEDEVIEESSPGDIAPLPRSVKKAATPKPPRKKAVAPKPEPVEQAPASVEAPPPVDEPWVAKISRPWAPVEPDGPSGPIVSTYVRSEERSLTGSSEDEFVATPAPGKKKTGVGRKRETDPLADEFAPPQRQRRSAPIVEEKVEEKVEAKVEAKKEEPKAEEPKKERPSVALFDRPARKLPRPAPTQRPAPSPPQSKRRVAPSAKTILAEPRKEPEPKAHVRNLEPPAPKHAPKHAPKLAPKPPLKPAVKPAPKNLSRAQRARILEGLGQPTPAAELPPLEHVYIPRASRPRAARPDRIGIFSPRHAVGWGLAIAATLVAGVITLKFAPSQAAHDHPIVQQHLSDIALTSIPGNYVVVEDTQTKSQTLAELARDRSHPEYVYAATIKNSDGDIVALYEAIVFPTEIAQSKGDLDNFISLYAQGAGVSGEAFTQRSLLGHRMVWSALLPQGQAVLVFKGAEVVIVITSVGGADGDTLADTILSARQL